VSPERWPHSACIPSRHGLGEVSCPELLAERSLLL